MVSGHEENIGAAEYAAYEKKAATVGAARMLDPQTAGEFAGGVLGRQDFTKFGANAADVAAGVGNRQLGILAEGRGEMPVLARQQAKVNAALVNEDALRGAVQSPEEAAALVSVAAESSPADAAEMVRASLRAMQKYDDKETGPMLARAKIVSGMSPIAKFKALAPVVEAEARASGRNVKEVLQTTMGLSELETQGVGVMLNKGVTGGLFDKRADVAAKLAGEAPTRA
jgi:hypothetical protein